MNSRKIEVQDDKRPVAAAKEWKEDKNTKLTLWRIGQLRGPGSAEAEAAISTSGGGHRSRRLFWIPSSAAIKTHVLKDHHACLQVDRRFGSQTTLASLAALYVSCPL